MAPEISDERFLMGGSGIDVEVGGNNDGHFHGKGNISIGTSGNHSHTYDTLSARRNRGSIGSDVWGDGTTTSTTGNSHSHTNSNFSGNIGNLSGFDGDVDGSNRPGFFKVKYFIKIN